MSKKFTPAKAAPSTAATEDNDPDVKMRKVSGNKYKTGEIEDKTVGGSSGPSYNFTGVIPGSECCWLAHWCCHI